MNIERRPHTQLRLDVTNPRITSGLAPDEIDELALDIGLNGLRYPLQVSPDGVVLEGGRRFRAIGRLISGWDRIREGDPDIDRAREKLREAALSMVTAGVPVLVSRDTPAACAARALADNLQRAELSSYEIAQSLWRMADRFKSLTQAEIATMVGKSRGYVSQAISTWERATPELKAEWLHGKRSYLQIRKLAELAPDAQRAALIGDREVNGHGRPGIDLVKASLRRFKPSADPYEAGVRAALAWVTGQGDRPPCLPAEDDA